MQSMSDDRAQEATQESYSIIHPLFMSFFSKSLYRDVGRNWKGLCFTYLILLLALCWIPTMIQFHSVVSEFVTVYAPPFVDQIPAITISEGEVSTPELVPYFIRDPESDALLAIIDTTGEFTSLDDFEALDEFEAQVLITKTKIIVEENVGETNIYDVSRFTEDFFVDQSRIYGWLEIIKSWLAIVSYPFALLVSLLYRIIQVLIYAAIGILFAKGLHTSWNYPALIRLAVISITPVVALETLRGLENIQIPLWWLICFLTAMGYLFYAVKASSTAGIDQGL